MIKYVQILKIPECGYVVIGERTINYSVGDVVDVSECACSDAPIVAPHSFIVS